MKSWLIIVALLSGCSGQHAVTSRGAQAASLPHLTQTAADIERECGLAAGSLLHPRQDGSLYIHAAAPSKIAAPQFSCVLAAIDKSGLEERGIKVFLTGEDTGP